MDDIDSGAMSRADVLKRVGLTSVVALTGVVASESEGEALQPFNLSISSGSSGGGPAVRPRAPGVLSSLSFTDITYVQVSESLDLLVVPLGTAPSKIGLFFMPDANPDDSDVGDGTGRHLTVNYKPPIYIVIVYK